MASERIQPSTEYFTKRPCVCAFRAISQNKKLLRTIIKQVHADVLNKFPLEQLRSL